MRQEWINELRSNIAEFVGLFEFYDILNRSAHASVDDGQKQRLERMIMIESKLCLLINPKERMHGNLIEEVQSAIANLHRSDISEKERDERSHKIAHEITAIAQRILKQEWEVVKSHN